VIVGLDGVATCGPDPLVARAHAHKMKQRDIQSLKYSIRLRRRTSVFKIFKSLIFNIFPFSIESVAHF
jgi:hypothetical protein